MSNILDSQVNYALKKPQQSVPGYFDDTKGAWVDSMGTFLCDNGLLDCLGTKKEDIETGEDVKGE